MPQVTLTHDWACKLSFPLLKDKSNLGPGDPVSLFSLAVDRPAPPSSALSLALPSRPPQRPLPQQPLRRGGSPDWWSTLVKRATVCHPIWCRAHRGMEPNQSAGRLSSSSLRGVGIAPPETMSFFERYCSTVGYRRVSWQRQEHDVYTSMWPEALLYDSEWS